MARKSKVDLVALDATPAVFHVASPDETGIRRLFAPSILNLFDADTLRDIATGVKGVEQANKRLPVRSMLVGLYGDNGIPAVLSTDITTMLLHIDEGPGGEVSDVRGSIHLYRLMTIILGPDGVTDEQTVSAWLDDMYAAMRRGTTANKVKAEPDERESATLIASYDAINADGRLSFAAYTGAVVVMGPTAKQWMKSRYAFVFPDRSSRQ